MNNNHIEHEPQIVTTRGTFRKSELNSVKAETIPTPKKIIKACPFKNTACRDDCAINVGGVCALLPFLTGGDSK